MKSLSWSKGLASFPLNKLAKEGDNTNLHSNSSKEIKLIKSSVKCKKETKKKKKKKKKVSMV